MKLNELEFDIIEDDNNIEIINEFFEIYNEPIPTGRTYKGWKHSSTYPYLFGLREKPMEKTLHEDENYLVGFPPDCSKPIVNGMLRYNTKQNMGPQYT